MDLINWISWNGDTVKVKNNITTPEEQGEESLTGL